MNKEKADQVYQDDGLSLKAQEMEQTIKDEKVNQLVSDWLNTGDAIVVDAFQDIPNQDCKLLASLVLAKDSHLETWEGAYPYARLGKLVIDQVNEYLESHAEDLI